MKIIIIHEFGEHTGITQFINNVINNLAEYTTKNNIEVITPKIVKEINKEIKQVIIPFISFKYPFSRIMWYIYLYFKLRAKKFDLMFCPANYGLFNIWPFNFYKNKIKVLAIHDLMWERKSMRSGNLIPLIFTKILIPLSIKFSDHIITVSHFSKKEIIESKNISSEDISVVYEGVSKSFRRVEDQSKIKKVKVKHNLPDKFILNVGSIKPNKNIINLVKAFCLLAETDLKINLVLTGKILKDTYSKRLVKLIDNLPKNIRYRIKFRVNVSLDDLIVFYNLADLFVMPSAEEGFGLPVLEAMACGCPVLTSNVSSLPEVAGNAAILVNPDSIKDIYINMEKVLSDPAFHSTLSQKGLKRIGNFNWKKTAKETYRIFLRLYKKNV